MIARQCRIIAECLMDSSSQGSDIIRSVEARSDIRAPGLMEELVLKQYPQYALLNTEVSWVN